MCESVWGFRCMHAPGNMNCSITDVFSLMWDSVEVPGIILSIWDKVSWKAWAFALFSQHYSTQVIIIIALLLWKKEKQRNGILIRTEYITFSYHLCSEIGSMCVIFLALPSVISITWLKVNCFELWPRVHFQKFTVFYACISSVGIRSLVNHVMGGWQLSRKNAYS